MKIEYSTPQYLKHTHIWLTDSGFFAGCSSMRSSIYIATDSLRTTSLGVINPENFSTSDSLQEIDLAGRLLSLPEKVKLRARMRGKNLREKYVFKQRDMIIECSIKKSTPMFEITIPYSTISLFDTLLLGFAPELKAKINCSSNRASYYLREWYLSSAFFPHIRESVCAGRYRYLELARQGRFKEAAINLYESLHSITLASDAWGHGALKWNRWITQLDGKLYITGYGEGSCVTRAVNIDQYQTLINNAKKFIADTEFNLPDIYEQMIFILLIAQESLFIPQKISVSGNFISIHSNAYATNPIGNLVKNHLICALTSFREESSTLARLVRRLAWDEVKELAVILRGLVEKKNSRYDLKQVNKLTDSIHSKVKDVLSKRRK